LNTVFLGLDELTDFAAIGTGGLRGKKTKSSTFEISRSKVKVTGGQTCERDVSETGEPTVLQIGTNSSQGKEMNRSTFRVRRSKVKVT